MWAAAPGTSLKILATNFETTTGIDPSEASIKLARSKSSGTVQYTHASAEEYSRITKHRFDTVVAHMTLMDSPNLNSILEAINILTTARARFVFTITHPWFWPRYWGYADADWFTYADEIFIEAEFSITASSSGLTSTHVHRPLEMYYSAIRAAGFSVDSISEPTPSDESRALHPDVWRYPRFLMFTCSKGHLGSVVGQFGGTD